MSCRHNPSNRSLPAVSAEGSHQQEEMIPDQVNTAGWDRGWTNLINDVEQTFVPSLHKLTGIEVELLVGNVGKKQEDLTLVVMDAAGKRLVSVTQSVSAGDCDHLMFVMPESGVAVTPGLTYRMRLSGDATFGWKYIAGGYDKGAATFNGRPLLSDTRSTFLFRTFGADQRN